MAEMFKRKKPSVTRKKKTLKNQLTEIRGTLCLWKEGEGNTMKTGNEKVGGGKAGSLGSVSREKDLKGGNRRTFPSAEGAVMCGGIKRAKRNIKQKTAAHGHAPKVGARLTKRGKNQTKGNTLDQKAKDE